MSTLRGFSTRRRQCQLDPSTDNANEHLDQLIGNLESNEHVSKTIQQSATKLIDEVLLLGKLETNLTHDLTCKTNIFICDERIRDILEDWYSFAGIQNNLTSEYVITLKKNLIEPLKLLKHAFDEIKTQIRANCALQLVVIKLQRKMAGFVDRPMTGKNLVKKQELRRTLITTQTEYAKQTQKLINDLTKFSSGGMEMLTPLLSRFLSSEIVWVHSSKRAIQLQTYCLDSSYLHENPADRIRTIDDTMRSLDALSICRESR